MTLPAHLFCSSADGSLYDTRQREWHKLPPLRAIYRRGFPTIETGAEFKATLRNGKYAWPGGYPLYFVCSDGAPLCFDCGRKELRNILSAIQNHDHSGWRVVATDINYEDTELHCEHCSKQIESTYGDDE